MGACELCSAKLKVEDVGETLVGRRVCSLVLSSLASILKAGWACSSTGDAWRGLHRLRRKGSAESEAGSMVGGRAQSSCSFQRLHSLHYLFCNVQIVEKLCLHCKFCFIENIWNILVI